MERITSNQDQDDQRFIRLCNFQPDPYEFCGI